MKKRNPILVVICMAILAGIGFYTFQAGAAKAEIKDYMDSALKGYTYSENEDVNATSYTKGQVSDTFSFDDGDIIHTR